MLCEWKYFCRKFIACSFMFIIVKSIIPIKIILAQIDCLFLFVYYCKRYRKNENISGANLLLVLFCLLLLEVSYEWKYVRGKFIACSVLFIIVKSIMRMKILLAQFYSLFLFAYYCKKYQTNKNMFSGNLLLVPFCLLL